LALASSVSVRRPGGVVSLMVLRSRIADKSSTERGDKSSKINAQNAVSYSARPVWVKKFLFFSMMRVDSARNWTFTESSIETQIGTRILFYMPSY
jgi:hypothetical protein